MRQASFGMNSLLRSLCALGALLLLGGCASREPLPEYYVLTPPGAAASGSTHGIRVFIRAVNVPGYLNTAKLVSRRGATQIEYAPAARWSENLGEGIKRALMASLAQQPGIGAVSATPYGIPPARDYDLTIDVQRFEGDDAGNAAATLRWTLFRPESGDPIVSRVSRQARAGWKYGDYPTMANLLSADLAAAGAEIARGIRR